MRNEPLPGLKLTRAGSEEGKVDDRVVQPVARSVSQSAVQLFADSDSGNCPPLLSATRAGDTILIEPFSSSRSGA